MSRSFWGIEAIAALDKDSILRTEILGRHDKSRIIDGVKGTDQGMLHGAKTRGFAADGLRAAAISYEAKHGREGHQDVGRLEEPRP